MGDVDDFLARVTPARRRRDADVLLRVMREETSEEPTLDRSMIGFGSYHYRYASGREGDAAAASFAPRKAATTIYLMDGVAAHKTELSALGPHTTGVGCLYIKDLGACDLDVLRRVIRRSYVTLTAGTFGDRAAGPSR